MEAQVKCVYKFGPFTLDPMAHVLLRGTKAIPLTPKAFETLLFLVRQPGVLIPKNQLLNALWPDSYVEENNLNQYISMLRKALEENGSGTKYIETMPRLGYRFVAAVEEVGDEKEEPLAAEAPASENEIQAPPTNGETAQPSRKQNWRMRMVVAAIIVLGISVGAYRWYWDRTRTVSPTSRTLAVLPLRNLKPDPETDFLGMALADAIINRLGYVNELNVEPLSSAARYRNSDTDPRQIARDLNVNTVLTGSYVKEGDELRITTELINADKATNPARDSIELKYEKLMTVQDRVASSVIHSLGLELQPEELDRLRKGLPTEPMAYEFYLRGTDAAFHSDFQRSAELLEKSVALEPGNAMAWAELGNVYLGYARIQGGGASYAEKGWEAFRRAMALDGSNPLIVDVMALHLIENDKADEAIAALRDSLAHNPHDSFAHLYLSEAYRYGGALDQSLAEGELALRLNPKVGQNLLLAYIYAGQYEKFLDSLPVDETDPRIVFYRGLGYYYLNDFRRAGSEFVRAFALNPQLLHARIGRALDYAITQQRDQGIELMRQVEQFESADGEMVYKMAQVYTQLGDKQAGLRLMQRSIDLNFYPSAYFLHDPLLDPLRDQPQFASMIELARQRQQAFLKRFF